MDNRHLIIITISEEHVEKLKKMVRSPSSLLYISETNQAEGSSGLSVTQFDLENTTLISKLAQDIAMKIWLKKYTYALTVVVALVETVYKGFKVCCSYQAVVTRDSSDSLKHLAKSLEKGRYS